MEANSAMRGWLIVWIVVVGLIGFALSRKSVRKTTPSVGLTIAFLAHLTILHWFGAFIHTLPWYYTPDDSYFVELGFVQSVYGVVAFGFGCLILSPFLFNLFGFSWLRERPFIPHPRLPRVYMITGLIFYSVLEPIIGDIPSIRTFVYSGWNLLIVGICLKCWASWQANNKKALMRWLIIAGLFPFFTMVTQGFLGVGMGVLLVILVFVSSFYRPRWRTIVGAVIIMYLGLSFYVNYMSSRDELRERVWGGEELPSRVEVISDMVGNFEALDIHNEEHLGHLDGRINLNFLVGAAVDYLKSGGAEYARGETIWQSLLAMIPRILWSEKPIVMGGSEMVAKYTGMHFAEGTSVAMGLVMDFYVNFSTVGVVIGFIILGVVLRFLDVIAARRLNQGDWQGFTFWYLPGLSFMGEPHLFQITMTMASSIVFCIFVNKYILPRFAGKRVSQ
ncbi:MAG: hypothetical protein JSW40_07630 [Candidatus Omnitrophota bacterium]|nr:MAG: hypothetical protein JSW40_07630 [Candidatus Omnitrophota bacterium]